MKEFYRNGYKFTVEVDSDAHYVFFDDKDITEENKAFVRKQLDEYAGDFFYVTQFSMCGACGQWEPINSMGGIFEQTESKAIDSFLEYFPLNEEVTA